MTLMLQDVFVTLVTTGAVLMLVRRVVGTFSPGPTKKACGGCSSCPSADAPRVAANARRQNARASIISS
jgi:hypothetical protein